jgi:hypothetical protein
MVTKRNFFVFFLIFQSFFVNAELFDEQYGKPAPDIMTPTVTDCSGAGAMSIADCRDELAAQIATQIANYGDGTTAKMGVRTELVYTQTETNLNASQGTWVQYLFQNPERWVNYSQSNVSKNASIVTVTAPACPDPTFPDYVVSKFIDINGNQVLYCFEQADLNFRDSCPDSTQDGSYLLPASTSNTADSICLDKPDGSSCKYQKTNDVYTTDFENDCYELNGAPRYDENEISAIDETDPDCQNIGGFVSACIENPDNVCDSNGICNQGCGSVAVGDFDPVFVCLSGDNDSDGVPDYKDPDIDGDGIANNDDLDNDNDGIDDETFPDFNTGGGSTVNVDTSTLEGIGNSTNSKLDGIKSELDKTTGSGAMPTIADGTDESITATNSYNRIANTSVVLAFTNMSNFINFSGTNGCPDLSFYLPSPIDDTVGTTIHCDLVPVISSIITPVMLAIYLWLGFRVFASA